MEKIVQYYSFNKTSAEYARFLLELYYYDPDISISDALIGPSTRGNITIFFQIEKEIASFLKLKHGTHFVKDPFGLGSFDKEDIFSMPYKHINEINKYIKIDILKTRIINESFDLIKLDNSFNKIKD